MSSADVDGWCARIAHALACASAGDPQLYAGDDRRRFARRQVARAGRTRKAAVLIPIIGGEPPRIVLTQRSQSLRSHPGQISFPGGSVEAFDEGAEAAAIRESHEEIGLDPARAAVLGRLPDYVTGTGYDIAPFVAWLPADVRLAADTREVARMFTMPLSYALDRNNFRREAITINSMDYMFHVIEYESNYVWGATAAMLYGLCTCVASTRAV